MSERLVFLHSFIHTYLLIYFGVAGRRKDTEILQRQYWGSPASLISGDWCGVIKSSQNTYEYFLYYFFLRSIYLLYFKVDYWQYDENKRKFFEKFAKRRNFDPLVAAKLVQYFDSGY